jgi:DNA-binding LacI/PurR family transcriptional regulator
LPDAIFCLNDALALGALRAFLVAGVRVPDDVAIIGFDDLEEGRYSYPSLSTVAPGRREIAQLSIDLLRRRMSTGFTAGDGPQEVFAAYELVVRESTGGTAPTAAQPSRTPVRSTSRDRYVMPGLSTVDG